jgi:hypothetical protein
MLKSVLAVQHVRRMHGGAQSHLLRCSDGYSYVVKFQNNPQGSRTLVNDTLGNGLAQRLGLPVPQIALVNVWETLICEIDEMTIQLKDASTGARSALGISNPGLNVSNELLILRQSRSSRNQSRKSGTTMTEKP